MPADTEMHIGDASVNRPVTLETHPEISLPQKYSNSRISPQSPTTPSWSAPTYRQKAVGLLSEKPIGKP